MPRQTSLFDWARTAAPRATNPQSGGIDALGPEAREIWRVLDRDCRGMDRAVPAPTVGLRAGLWADSSADVRGRNVRVLIAAHLDDFPGVVMATSAGYYVAESPEELERGHQVLRSRMREQYQREMAVIRSGRARGWEYLGEGRWRR